MRREGVPFLLTGSAGSVEVVEDVLGTPDAVTSSDGTAVPESGAEVGVPEVIEAASVDSVESIRGGPRGCSAAPTGRDEALHIVFALGMLLVGLRRCTKPSVNDHQIEPVDP